jgi:hypothetical protein
MKLVCAPKGSAVAASNTELNVILYDRSDVPDRGSVGGAISETFAAKGLIASARAWDLLSIALSVVTADLAGHRDKSSDGWTREFSLTIAVIDPGFWNGQSATFGSSRCFHI